MTIPQLLHTMCAEISNADLNAIRKARGFGVKETDRVQPLPAFI